MTPVSSFTLTCPDDWHLHLRDGAALQAVIGDSARQFARAIIMPNLRVPITTTQLALAYRGRILEALAAKGLEKAFQPLMTLYLTDNTSAEEIRCAHGAGIVAVKLYPAGATTNSDAGVSDLLKHCTAALTALQTCGMPLLVHGEVTDPAIDLFDREAVFIDRVMIPLRRQFPELKVVFEHLTTKEGVDYVREAEGPIGATLTPQHLLYNRNALFTGGIQPHWYCLPVLKRETHRLALVEAATSGNPRFFLGTDSAPHARILKEHACGCAGCYTGLHAMALYATLFDRMGKLDCLEGFASHFGADFYGLARNTSKLTLRRERYTIPNEVPFGNTTLVPLAAGESLSWCCEFQAPSASSSAGAAGF
jgi:dihydroorotase